MRKVFKYGTGDEVPEGAEYLYSCVQETESLVDNVKTMKMRFVWHYFLVNVKE